MACAQPDLAHTALISELAQYLELLWVLPDLLGTPVTAKQLYWVDLVIGDCMESLH